MVDGSMQSRRSDGLPCPVCKVALVMSEKQGIEIDYCPQCRGVWLDRGELDKIIERSAIEEARYARPRDAGPIPPPQPYPNQPYPGPGYDDHGGHGHGHGHGHHGGHGRHGGHGHHRYGLLGRLFD